MRRSYIFWVVAFVVFLVLVYLLRGILLPFVAGLAVAYFVDPVCDRLEERGLSRTTATVLVTSVFFILFVGAVVLLLPMIVSQISGLIARVPGYYADLQVRATGLLELAQSHIGQDTQERAREFLTGFSDSLGPWLTNLAKNLVSGSVALANLLSLIVITPIVAFYLLRDWDRMVATIDSWLPRHHAQTVRGLIGEINERIAGFVRGQVTVCLILGTFYALALSLTGLEFGMVVGMLAGVVSFIPFVGSILGFIASVGLAVAQFGDLLMVGLVAIIFGIGQVAEGNFLTPKLVGEQIGLHPVWVMFSLLACGSLFGFVGVLIAVPLAAVAGVMVKFALQQYLSSSFYTGV